MPRYKSPFLSLYLSVAAQFLAFIASLKLGNFISTSLFVIPCHSLFGYLLAKLFRLSKPWQIANAVFPFAILLGVKANFPSLAIALVFITMAAVYLPTYWTGVPFYPTPKKAYAAVAELLPKDKPFCLIDLGCGTASMLLYLAKERPNGRYCGLELSPAAFLCAWSMKKLLRRPNVEIHFANFWKHDLGPYDFAYAFLAPPPMSRLWDKAKGEMKKGSRVISNTFEIKGQRAKRVEVDGDWTLLSYRV